VRNTHFSPKVAPVTSDTTLINESPLVYEHPQPLTTLVPRRRVNAAPSTHLKTTSAACTSHYQPHSPLHPLSSCTTTTASPLHARLHTRLHASRVPRAHAPCNLASNTLKQLNTRLAPPQYSPTSSPHTSPTPRLTTLHNSQIPTR
jgi:hypothetical protein